MEALNAPPVEQIPISLARDNYEKLSRYQGGVPVSMMRTEDRFISSVNNRTIPIRIYWPTLQEAPVLLYFHGGGWSRGSVNTHDALCRRLAKSSGNIIVSVDYGLAPENPYPNAVEDGMSMYEWVQRNALSLGGFPGKVAIGGDSAGGNISAAICSHLADQGGVLPAFQLLIYPSLDLTFKQKSVKLFGDGFMLTENALHYYASEYVKHHSLKSWGVSPLFYPKLHLLPNTIVLTAECDPIRDDGLVYAQRLLEAGVHVKQKNVSGMIHGFMQLIDTFPTQTQEAYDWLGSSIKSFWANI